MVDVSLRALGCALAALLLVVPHAGAGDGNQLFITQDSLLATGTEPNTLRVDQSNASNSLVGGPSVNSLVLGPMAPSDITGNALQIGSGNAGSITVEGDGGVVSFVQSGVGGAVGTNNTATVNLGGGAEFAAIEQLGARNAATLDVPGLGSDGSIFQDGAFNEASLTVDGADVGGTIIQNGDNNIANLEVSGTPGSSVTLEQLGNGLSSANVGGVPGATVTPASPAIQIFTNASGVTITQSN